MEYLKFYRNYNGVYHAVRKSKEWEQLGKSICGADISKPAFCAVNFDEIRNSKSRLCKHCKNRLEKELNREINA